jgi:hypothetical protein
LNKPEKEVIQVQNELNPKVVIVVILIVVVVLGGLIWKFTGGKKSDVISMKEIQGSGKGQMASPGGGQKSPGN